jgi:transcriptional regulator CtsR
MDTISQYRKLAREIAENSIVTKALAKMLEQVVEEAVKAERERCLLEICYQADWLLKDVQNQAVLLDDIRARIRGEA